MKKGDKVTYTSKGANPKIQKGIVKDVVNATLTRVVYNCGGDWENYENYISQLTTTKDLKSGWNEKSLIERINEADTMPKLDALRHEIMQEPNDFKVNQAAFKKQKNKLKKG